MEIYAATNCEIKREIENGREQMRMYVRKIEMKIADDDDVGIVVAATVFVRDLICLFFNISVKRIFFFSSSYQYICIGSIDVSCIYFYVIHYVAAIDRQNSITLTYSQNLF